MKNRVTGIGGIFFKCENPEKTMQWYKEHLGMATNNYGCTFPAQDTNGKKTTMQWSPFDSDTKYFSPSEKEFMINYRVENLEELLEVLKNEGVTIVGDMETYDYGKFGWILDPEGNKIELWEPSDT